MAVETKDLLNLSDLHCCDLRCSVQLLICPSRTLSGSEGRFLIMACNFFKARNCFSWHNHLVCFYLNAILLRYVMVAQTHHYIFEKFHQICVIEFEASETWHACQSSHLQSSSSFHYILWLIVISIFQVSMVTKELTMVTQNWYSVELFPPVRHAPKGDK